MKQLQKLVRYTVISIFLMLILCCFESKAFGREKAENDTTFQEKRIPVIELESLDFHKKDCLQYDYVIKSASGKSIFLPSPISVDSIIDITIEIVPSYNEIPSFSNPISLDEIKELTVLINSDSEMKKCRFHFNDSFYGGVLYLTGGLGYKWTHIVLTPEIYDQLVFEDGQLRIKNVPDIDENRNNTLICTHAKTFSGRFVDLPNNSVLGAGKTVAIRNDKLKSIEMWKKYLEAQFADGTPIEIVYQSLSGNAVRFPKGLSLPDDLLINSICSDHGIVDIYYEGEMEPYAFNPLSDSDEDCDWPKGMVLVKVPRLNADGSVLIPRIKCADTIIKEGIPKYSDPRTVTEFSKILESPVVMNGGFFALSKGTNIPHGTIISDGMIVVDDIYKNDHNEMALCIKDDGCFTYEYSDQLDAKALLRDNVIQCLCGLGPIISNSETLHDMIRSYRVNDGSINVLSYNENSYFILTSSDETSLEYSAVILGSLGVTEAYVMDGGGSVGTAVYGIKINKHIDATGDRPITDVVYFK